MKLSKFEQVSAELNLTFSISSILTGHYSNYQVMFFLKYALKYALFPAITHSMFFF